MTQRKKNNIIIGSLCAVVLLMAVGYAAFSSILNIKGTTNIASNWNILITNVESKNIVGSASNAEEPSWENLTATFKTNLVSPGDSIEYDITVSNKGNLNAVLDKITLSDSNNPAIKFTSSGLEEGSELNAGDSKILTVKVEYDSNVTSQPESTEGTFTVTLDYSQKEGSSEGPNPITPSDLISGAVTSGDGLYADEYEAGRYVYKGANPNNYITFNDESWRIIAIEPDNTLKIIKNDSIGDMVFDSSNLNNWTRPATLNTYLNNTYYNSLTENAKLQIQEYTWKVGPITPKNTDLNLQIQSENKIIQNSKIGFITVSDFLKANTNTTDCGNLDSNNTNRSTCKETNYLIPLSFSFWTSPVINDTHYVFTIGISGGVYYDSADNKIGVLPSTYLIPNITLSGEGTSTNPYTIVS